MQYISHNSQDLFSLSFRWDFCTLVSYLLEPWLSHLSKSYPFHFNFLLRNHYASWTEIWMNSSCTSIHCIVSVLFLSVLVFFMQIWLPRWPPTQDKSQYKSHRKIILIFISEKQASNHFRGSHLSAPILLLFLIIRSTEIRYQKNVFRYMTKITLKFIWLLY